MKMFLKHADAISIQPMEMNAGTAKQDPYS